MSRKWDGLLYDIFLWVFNVVVDLFFREVHPRSSWRIPRRGPVIFVAAPHANQFVDPLLLMRTVRQDAHRRIAFLIAEKSMRRMFVGFAAGLVGSVPVGRALDSKKPAKGRIYLPDPEGDPTVVRGTDTDFENGKFMIGGLLVLPSVDNTSANAEIKEIVGPDEIRLKKPFKGDVAYQQLTGKEVKDSNGNVVSGGAKERKGEKFEGTSFSVAPHIDQGEVYEAVFRRLRDGGCIGIFPEGGSHDRTELLPLKAGVAIMALGALAEDPTCGVVIVPVGMNYFHAHKFRSRAVIEFGSPIEVEKDLIEQYKNGQKREATGALLEEVFQGLQSVTTLAPDYETLMLIQAVRRLYNPKGKRLPLSQVVELNRRLMKGYTTYKDDPRVKMLTKAVLDYNKQLMMLNIRDHQVAYAKIPWYKVIFLLFYRTLKLAVLSIAVLPGAVLFSPVFILGKIISRQKSKEALKASTVKIKAKDVIATWKILVSLALAPTLDIIYTSALTGWTHYNRVQGYLPEWLPLWLVFVLCLIFFPMVCFAALRFGEIGMDIFKSLRPLLLSLNPTSGNTLVKLRKTREWLLREINDLINDLGPQLYDDFEKWRIISDPTHPLHSPPRSRPDTPSLRRDGDDDDVDTPKSTPATPPPFGRAFVTDSLPRNESFKNLGSIGLFASRPSTPNRSRSRTNSGSEGFGRLHGFTTLQQTPKSKPDLDEVSKNLHAAMRERGRRRTSVEGEQWEFDRSDGGVTPNSELETESRKDR